MNPTQTQAHKQVLDKLNMETEALKFEPLVALGTIVEL